MGGKYKLIRVFMHKKVGVGGEERVNVREVHSSGQRKE